MIRLAFIADLHIANHRLHGGEFRSGINDRGQATLDAFGNALSLAEAKHADKVIVLGDVFDTTQQPHQVVAAAQRMVNGHSVPVTIIKGNHDECSSDAGDHALGPLAETRGVTVLEQPTIEIISPPPGEPGGSVEIWYVPYRTGPAKDWLPGVLEQLAQDSPADGHAVVHVLCVHLGVHDVAMRDDPANFWVEDASDAISFERLALLCLQHSVEFVFAGNWHSYRRFFHADPGGAGDVCVVQVGALCPTGWDNPGFAGYGSVVYLDVDPQSGGTVGYDRVPGPRFLSARTTDELALQLGEASAYPGNDLYVRLTVSPEEVSIARAALESMRESGTIYVADVRVDKDGVEKAARSAAAAAQSATTREEAVCRFVDRMPVKPTVDRAEVRTLCLGYLR